MVQNDPKPANAHNKDFAQAQEAIFVPSVAVPADAIKVEGPNFNAPTELFSLLDSYGSIGFQATSLKQAMDVINEMKDWRLSDEPIAEDESEELCDPEVRKRTKCKVMLGFTSNLISSGLREVIKYLVQNQHVSGIVTTAGGIEEDLIKCLAPTFIAPEGRFDADGATLRKQGLNRIGNLVVPNNNYCKFEDWVMPVLDQMVVEQKTAGTVWAPSTVIDRLGREINHEESYLYWAHKNSIPVFCPALTDGSLGDMLWSHSYRTEIPLVIDIVSDIRRINDMSMYAKKAGMVILGGGVCKHQIANSMLMRNGADYAVYINTGQEFDGSDSGARPDEAISWGKIRAGAKSVKVYADATLVFPLIVAGTWARPSKANSKA